MGQFSYSGRPKLLGLSLDTSQKALLCSPVATPSGTGTPKPWKGTGGKPKNKDATVSTPVLATPVTPKPSERSSWRLESKDTTASPPMLPTPTTPAAPTISSPYGVTRYTPDMGSISRIENKGPKSSQKSSITADLASDDLASGDIITMCAALQHHGFSKADELRWFLVLGKKAIGTGLVIAPLATFEGRGKEGLTAWKAEWFLSVHKEDDYHSTSEDEGYGSLYDDEWDDKYEKPDQDSTLDYDEGYESLGDDEWDDKLNPRLLLFSKDYLCRTGSVVPLTTAFVVKPDHVGRIPAKFDGSLTKESFDDFWKCLHHLMEHHHEQTQYLFQTELSQWEWKTANSHRSKCRTMGCALGASLKSP